MSHRLIQHSKDILGGTPVFFGTRVPVQTLMDYLEAGSSIKDFVEDFPSVNIKQAIAVLEEMKKAVLGGKRASAA